mmetsp:Transcript_1161/g.2683  ORF Transcript_1161/g.2683 Transcript_1161/m.2683 type:complete len:161 (-) Transcript_1161:150-632(-)|eukprot:CAMPEP_0176189302 /NCGR_PEP_ID=MMETSP0121_2-20121125/3362_1 /TAXON_ID=160619 /ORGANISM="Kryptoperidinium foliaceum, Strain CCMP 1326" /LENGTH=160 /DNA_ID=CAMNT_0017527907 /DNA_START=53 /DNA_END=535 /DNA_ORIENTATION=+
MRPPVGVLALLLLSITNIESFVPTVAVQVRTKTATETRVAYKNRDEIAHELIELIPGEHRAHTKDYSPWKRIVELERAEDQVQELQKKLDKVKKEEKAIENLEQVAYALFLQIALLGEERNSIPKLVKRLFRLTTQRINKTIGKNVDRALKALHMFHEYE